MKQTTEKIIQAILNFRLGSVQKGIETFRKNKELFLEESKSKIEDIIEKDLSNKELLFEILSHDYIRPAFVIQDKDYNVPSDHPWAPLLNMYQANIKRAIGCLLYTSPSPRDS